LLLLFDHVVDLQMDVLIASAATLSASGI